jgi:hypothetical protein
MELILSTTGAGTDCCTTVSQVRQWKQHRGSDPTTFVQLPYLVPRLLADRLDGPLQGHQLVVAGRAVVAEYCPGVALVLGDVLLGLNEVQQVKYSSTTHASYKQYNMVIALVCMRHAGGVYMACIHMPLLATRVVEGSQTYEYP